MIADKKAQKGDRLRWRRRHILSHASRSCCECQKEYIGNTSAWNDNDRHSDNDSDIDGI